MSAAPEPGLSDLFGQLGRDLSVLLRDEVRLARVEIEQDARKLSRAGAMLGAGGVAALLTVLILSFAAAWGLAEAIPAGFAFLIVGVVWGVVAAVLFVSGRKRLRDSDLAPHRTIETIQEDVQWLRQQTN